MIEIWKPFHKGLYEASSLGRVRRVGRGLLTQHFDHKGYARIKVTVKNKQSHIRFVHQAVAEAFLGTRPFGLTINHKDGRKKNNKARNLEYVSNLENLAHAVRLNLVCHGERSPNATITQHTARKIKEFLRAGLSSTWTAGWFGVSLYIVTDIKRKRSWRRA